MDRLTPSFITLTKGLIAGGVNLAIGLSTSAPPSTVGAVTALGIGVVGYGLSITLWVTGARDLGAARGQVVFSAAPFMGVVVAWTLLGIALVVRSDHQHEHVHQPTEHAHEHQHDTHHPGHRHRPGLRTAMVIPTGTSRSGTATRTCPDLHHRHAHAGAGSTPSTESTGP